MKDLKHIKRFNESEENLNISDVRSSKEQLKHFLDYVRRYHVSSIPMDKIEDYVDGYLNSVEKDDVFIKMMKDGK
jgi:hypothetical protein